MVLGKGGYAAEVVAWFWTEKREERGVCVSQTRGGRHVVAGGDRGMAECVERGGGSLLRFQPPLSLLPLIPLLPLRPPNRQPSAPTTTPTPGPPCLCMPAFKDACGSLASCLSDWPLVTVFGGGSQRDRLLLCAQRRCCFSGLGFVTLGQFYTETGLSLLRFRPLLCFP